MSLRIYSIIIVYKYYFRIILVYMEVSMWAYLLIGLSLIGMGILVHVFKWHFLIAGYNTMPKEKKANVDTKGLGRLVGTYLYFNGIVFILAGAVDALGFKMAIAPALVIFGISTIFLLIRAKKYDGNVDDKSWEPGKGIWKKVGMPGIINTVVLIFVAVVMFFASQSTKVTLLDEGIKIHGMYGEVYKWESINDVKLMDELPAIERRTNGSALGSNLKGYFRTSEFGQVKLFVNAQKPPFIYLETDGRIAIFNLKNADETKEVYKEILKQME